MNRQTTDPSSSSGDATLAAAPSVFIPPMDPATGAWLSLGSYEEVFNSDWDYWAIHKALKQDNMTLDKVLRIHNSFLKERLDEELNLVKKGRSSDFDPNIQDLYHGTSESLERICNEGLDERLSTSGHFGRGIYFSDRPGVCRIQSEINSPTKPFIVRCIVILGDCKVYPEGQYDPSLTREPVKPTTTDGKNVFYDSVRGKTGDFNQFVIYQKRLAMVQYIIFYSTNDPLPSLPPIPRSESNSSKKKKKRTSGRHSTGSPRNDTPRSAAPSVGDGTQSESDHDSRSSGSVRSVVSSPSSDDNSSSDENSSHLGAVGGRRTPRTRSTGERSTYRDRSAQEQPEQTAVPKATSTRERTRRLMSKTETQSNAQSAAAASSSSASALVGKDPSYVDDNKKKMQEAAMKHMLDLKGHVPPDKISELWEDFSRTYGGGTSGDIVENIPSSAFSENEDVDVEAVIDVLVDEFRQIIPEINPRAARQYIIQFDMDINRAVGAYFESS